MRMWARRSGLLLTTPSPAATHTVPISQVMGTRICSHLGVIASSLPHTLATKPAATHVTPPPSPLLSSK